LTQTIFAMNWVNNCNSLGLLNVATCNICQRDIARKEVISHLIECSLKNLTPHFTNKFIAFYYTFCYIFGFIPIFNFKFNHHQLIYKTYAMSIYYYIYANRCGFGHSTPGLFDDITQLALTKIIDFNSRSLNISIT
jgi:hypothetical protein